MKTEKEKVLIIGIAGGSGSGKTTLVNQLQAHWVNPPNSQKQDSAKPGIAVLPLSQDHYFHPEAQPEVFHQGGLPNYDHPSVLDWTLMKQQLAALKSGTRVFRPVYDYLTAKRAIETVEVPPAQVYLFEGIYTALDPEVRGLVDFQIFLDVPADLRLARRILRDTQTRGYLFNEVIEEYLQNVRPMHELFVAPQIKVADRVYASEWERAYSEINEIISQWINRGLMPPVHQTSI